MASSNDTPVADGNAADEDAAMVLAATTADDMAHSVASDVASGNAVATSAATNPFFDSMLNPTEVHAVTDDTTAATALAAAHPARSMLDHSTAADNPFAAVDAEALPM